VSDYSHFIAKENFPKPSEQEIRRSSQPVCFAVQAEIFISMATFTIVLGTTEPSIQLVCSDLYPGAEQSECEGA
jgi:hypothetical protein